ncbi:hypothetical protein [Atlantibacter hermannii]|uniref:hypothetical protein n=1 Tax=Atlantibacter hermannii TaxID=565 RepID=UPI002800DBA3|nr:hypothetical protein [Atlantibacter hermannii]MDQ7883704.1 hypothetical protein [Atlantibacter hermannii]
MNIEFYIAVGVWAALLFVWLPIQSYRHKMRLKSLRAIRKGNYVMCKYQFIKSLTGGQSCQ